MRAGRLVAVSFVGEKASQRRLALGAIALQSTGPCYIGAPEIGSNQSQRAPGCHDANADRAVYAANSDLPFVGPSGGNDSYHAVLRRDDESVS